jgi:hypothetical protein
MKKWIFPVLVVALAVAGPANGSTVYDYSSGAIDVTLITISNGSSSSTLFSGSSSFALSSGSTLTLDSPTSPTQFTFNFGDTGGSVSLSGTYTFTGAGSNTDTLNFNAATASLANSPTALNFQSGSPISLTPSGGGGYTFNSGTVQGTGSASLSGVTLSVNGGTPTPVAMGAKSFGPATQPLTGTLGIAGGGAQVSLNGVTLGSYVSNGQTITVSGDIIFNGMPAVPLPASVWLFGSALGFLRFGPYGRRRAA